MWKGLHLCILTYNNYQVMKQNWKVSWKLSSKFYSCPNTRQYSIVKKIDLLCIIQYYRCFHFLCILKLTTKRWPLHVLIRKFSYAVAIYCHFQQECFLHPFWWSYELCTITDLFTCCNRWLWAWESRTATSIRTELS